MSRSFPLSLSGSILILASTGNYTSSFKVLSVTEIEALTSA